MPYNAILAIECLVQDYGWDIVLNALMDLVETVPEERLEEVAELLDAAAAVDEGKGQLFALTANRREA